MFETITPPWGWLTIGLILMVAEIMLPGFYLIWIGGAALLTGLIAFSGIPIAAQAVCFAILTIASIMVARRWFNVHPIGSTDPLLNNRGARMIGEIVTVVEPIEGGSGRVKIGDSVWTAYGADAGVGTKLRITGTSDQGGVIVEAV